MLAVLCYVCGYGIVCPSISICGSILIYYKQALLVYGCMRTLRVQPYTLLTAVLAEITRCFRTINHFYCIIYFMSLLVMVMIFVSLFLFPNSVQWILSHRNRVSFYLHFDTGVLFAV